MIFIAQNAAKMLTILMQQSPIKLINESSAHSAVQTNLRLSTALLVFMLKTIIRFHAQTAALAAAVATISRRSFDFSLAQPHQSPQSLQYNDCGFRVTIRSRVLVKMPLEFY